MKEFRVNYPYGIAYRGDGKWIAFNREYMPLGYRETELGIGVNYINASVPPDYENIPQHVLVELGGTNTIERNDSGIITKVFLYNDGTNPTNTFGIDEIDRLYNLYDKKHQLLTKYEVRE